jgi:hypothetical protein
LRPTGEGYLRISFATSVEMIERGLERMSARLPELAVPQSATALWAGKAGRDPLASCDSVRANERRLTLDESLSGLPSIISTSACLPLTNDPTSSATPQASAETLVALLSASIGDIPPSTIR